MINLKWCIAGTIFFAIVGGLTFLTSLENEVKDLILQFAGIVITYLGFFVAIYQLRITSNQYFDDLKKKSKDYLDLIVETKTSEIFYSIKTQVINKSGENKDIDYAFILITKQDDNIIEKVNQICELKKISLDLACTNSFNKFKDLLDSPIFINNVGIIPLDFYFSENLVIGNESPSFTYSFNNSSTGFEKGIYSVRFFIYPKAGYHRSTVDSMIIK